MSLLPSEDRVFHPPEADQDTVHTVFLGLGANLGDRADNIQRALAALGEKVRILGVSSLYETEPVGFREQPLFLNTVCRGETQLSPQELLRFAKGIEQRLGRRPAPPNHPRPIDIDILLYDDLTLDRPELTIPHPRMRERAFVLVPLAELAPNLALPGERATVSQMLAQLATEGVKVFGPPVPFDELKERAEPSAESLAQGGSHV